MSDHLAVPYDASRIEEKLARRRRLLRGRLISLGLTVAIVVGLYLWQRSRNPGGSLVVITIVILATAVAWTIGYAVAYFRAKRERASVGTGFALRVGRPGVEVAGLFVPWGSVASLAATKGGLGTSPRLRLITTDGAEATVPLDQIDVRPASVDSSVRAYSAGRHGVDLTALDN